MNWRSFFTCLALALCISKAEAADAAITGSDLAEIRQVIHRQIDAFRRDDAQGAFELVSPGVRHSFGTPERFLDVVRMAYRAVYRAANIAFLDLLVMSGEVVQQVQITDRAAHCGWRTFPCSARAMAAGA